MFGMILLLRTPTGIVALIGIDRQLGVVLAIGPCFAGQRRIAPRLRGTWFGGKLLEAPDAQSSPLDSFASCNEPGRMLCPD